MHSQGGFDYEAIYRMPVPMRNFYSMLMQEHLEESRKEGNKASESDSHMVKVPSYAVNAAKR